MNIFVLLNDKEPNLGARTYTEKKEQEFKELNNLGWGVYFAVNQFKERRKNDDIFLLRAVYADLDIAKKGDGQSREEKQKKKFVVLEALLDYCEPTKVIDTSNGLQPLWNLEDKSVSDENKKKYTQVIKGIVAWSKQYGCKADNVYDFARILRLPEYYHQKEEPYLCSLMHKSEKLYSYETLIEKFPFEEKVTPVLRQNDYILGPIDQAIQELDFQELIIRAFSSVGRKAEFDKTGRLKLDDRLTGTFQGRKDDRQYLASSSHEPFKGNKITAIADILGITNKEARKWIIDEYRLSYAGSKIKQMVKSHLQNVKIIVKSLKKKRYTWGTRILDTSFAIIKPNNFIVAGSKRGTGKTTFTFDMACKNAILGHHVVYISLEMDTEDILSDFGRKYCGMTIEEELDDKIPEIKQKAFDRRVNEIKENKNLHIIGLRSAEGICWETIVEVLNQQEKTDIIFLDNLDMIAGNEKEQENDRQKRIVKNIMAFTSEKQIPFVLIHHYRKSGNKDYGMDELSGSGKIADAADRVIKVAKCTDMEALYPENYASTIYLQKGRGYPECSKKIYFIKGTFCDDPRENENKTLLDSIKF